MPCHIGGGDKINTLKNKILKNKKKTIEKIIENPVKFFKNIKIREINNIEKKDPQYISINKLHQKMKGRDIDDEKYLRLVVGNAIICYQLSGKGEEYWKEFYEYFSEKKEIKNEIKELSLCLKKTKYNKRLTNIKMKRLKKLDSIINRINRNTTLKQLWILLGNKFGKDKKTTVFSVKMFGYAKRILMKKIEKYPIEIPIPVDSRIKKITREITSEDPKVFWQKIAEKTGISPLNIDSVLWNLYPHFVANADDNRRK